MIAKRKKAWGHSDTSKQLETKRDLVERVGNRVSRMPEDLTTSKTRGESRGEQELTLDAPRRTGCCKQDVRRRQEATNPRTKDRDGSGDVIDHQNHRTRVYRSEIDKPWTPIHGAIYTATNHG